MKPAAWYARVSSDRQKENHTISSQVAALLEYADNHGYLVPPEWRFQDEGYSGATLLRPGLEALRDLAAAGHIQAAFRCVIRQGDIDQKAAEKIHDRVRACWINPNVETKGTAAATSGTTNR